MRMLVFSLLFLMAVPALSAEIPAPVVSQEPPSTKGMVWNKWETDNFIVLSIDFGFGKRLKSSLEGMRAEFCSSWGVSDDSLPVKCKVVCVPDPAMLKRFFSLDAPRCEVRTDESKSPREIAVWMDEKRSAELPGLIASVCLNGSPAFVAKGVTKIVSLSPSEISDLILSSEGSPAGALRESEPSDGHSVVACLFFRKEFGSLLFSRIIAKNGPAPDKACGFSGADLLDSALKRYSDNLKSDLKSGKTPGSYLKP